MNSGGKHEEHCMALLDGAFLVLTLALPEWGTGLSSHNSSGKTDPSWAELCEVWMHAYGMATLKRPATRYYFRQNDAAASSGGVDMAKTQLIYGKNARCDSGAGVITDSNQRSS